MESTAWPPPACCGGEDGKKGRDDSNLGDWLGCQTKLSSSWYSRLSFIFPIVQLLGQPAHYLHSCQHFQVANRDKQAHPSALTSIVAVYYWIYTIIPKSSSTQPPQTVLPPSTSEGTALLTGGRPGGGLQGQDEQLARMAPRELRGNLLSCTYHQHGRQGNRQWILSHMAFRLICTVCCKHDRNGSFSINIPTSSTFLEEATYMIPVRSDDMAVVLIRYILKFRALSNKYLCICIA